MGDKISYFPLYNGDIQQDHRSEINTEKDAEQYTYDAFYSSDKMVVFTLANKNRQ